jgi:endonuclease YncB( thermonuclease family)
MKKFLLLLVVGLLSFTPTNVCEVYEAHVESVYDGDTFTADVFVGFDIVKDDVKIRLYGINAPEIRPLKTREQATISRDALIGLIQGEDVEIEYVVTDSFGRIVAKCYVQDTINVSDWMVRNGYAEYREY